MKAIVQETLSHPILGSIVKSFVYTFDEDLYTTVELAIDQGNLYFGGLNARQVDFNQAVVDLANQTITQQQFDEIKQNLIDWQNNTDRGWISKELFIEPDNDDDIDVRQRILLNAMIQNRQI